MRTSAHQKYQVPVIETERLRLRGPQPTDLEESTSLWSDVKVTRYTSGKSLSEEEVWARLLRYVGHWAWMGFGYWVVEEKATARFAGEVGFSDWKREIKPSLQGLPELGWVLASRVHGQGYATEAARAAIRWSHSHFRRQTSIPSGAEFESPIAPELGSAKMTCIIHPENVPSIRVAEKCGFNELLRTSYRGEPTIVLVQ
ncbi:MAG TPA: GNAT family N-acetyltransferase [Candidatus Acidoferrum sp.]|nr:GNAT family N-acetyltransferase [Candidatus Acidoferrum sp.]